MWQATVAIIVQCSASVASFSARYLSLWHCDQSVNRKPSSSIYTGQWTDLPHRKMLQIVTTGAPASQTKWLWEVSNHEVDLTKPYPRRAVPSVAFSGPEANSFSQDSLLSDLRSKISKWPVPDQASKKLSCSECERIHWSTCPVAGFRHFSLCKPLKSAPSSKTSWCENVNPESVYVSLTCPLFITVLIMLLWAQAKHIAETAVGPLQITNQATCLCTWISHNTRSLLMSFCWPKTTPIATPIKSFALKTTQNHTSKNFGSIIQCRKASQFTDWYGAFNFGRLTDIP